MINKNIQTSLKYVYSDNNTLSVIFHDNNLLMGVVGEFNKNLKELEKLSGVKLYSRGNSILIKSSIEKNEIVKKAFENIKQICIDLQKQTNCPEEDLKDFLEFISKQWNK